MSDAAADLLARALAARESWVDVADGVALCVRRPPAAELATLVGGITAARAARCVVGWRGVTLGHVLGAAAADGERALPAPFSAELCEAALLDNVDWLQAAAEALAAVIVAHLDAREAARKN